MDSLLLITPTLGKRTLEDYLEITSQGGPWQWVLVCPADVLADLAVRLAGKKGLGLTAERKGGMYAAINSAVERSSERWISYINDDDRLERGFNEMRRLHCVADNEHVIAYGRVRMIAEDGRDMYEFPHSRDSRHIEELWAENIMPFTQQGMIFSRRVWDELGGFSEDFRYSGDLDFWVRAKLAGFRFKYYDIVVACWRVRAGQLSADSEAVRQESARALAPVFALGLPLYSRILAKARFRCFNFPNYVMRFMRTGRLRQAEVFLR